MADCQEDGDLAFELPVLQDASNQIRLLRIFPARSDDDATIRCQITVHDSELVEGAYTAISYTWGPPEPSRPIKVNGHQIAARHNCWYALWQMRLHTVDSLYWIDSLCIDQCSHAEKASQVRQMDQIYSEAKQVAACIGDTKSDQWLYFGRQKNHPPPRDWSLVFDAIKERPYFRRAWTVQECLFAKSVRLFCGQYSTTLDTTVASRVRHSRTMARPRGLAAEDSIDPDVEKLVELLDDCSLAKDAAPNRRVTSRQPHEIVQYFARDCYDLRDKLYAVLSLLAPEYRQRLPINYEQSLLYVLMDFSNVYDRVEGDKSRATTQGSQAALSTLVKAVRALRSGFGSDFNFKSSEDDFLRGRFAAHLARQREIDHSYGSLNSHTKVAVTVDILFVIKGSSVGETGSSRQRRTKSADNQNTALITSATDAFDEWSKVLKHWRETSPRREFVPQHYLRPIVQAAEQCPLPRSLTPKCIHRCIHNNYGSVLRIFRAGIESAFMVPTDTAEDDFVLHHDGIFLVCRRSLHHPAAIHLVGEAIPLTGTSNSGMVLPIDPTFRQESSWRWECNISLPPADMLFFCLMDTEKHTSPKFIRFLVRTPIRSASMDLPVVTIPQKDITDCFLDDANSFLSSERAEMALKQYMLATKEDRRLAQERADRIRRLRVEREIAQSAQRNGDSNPFEPGASFLAAETRQQRELLEQEQRQRRRPGNLLRRMIGRYNPTAEVEMLIKDHREGDFGQNLFPVGQPR